MRIAPKANGPDTPRAGKSMVTVSCRVMDADGLRPGMTGHARVQCGQRRLGAILLERPAPAANGVLVVERADFLRSEIGPAGAFSLVDG
jgi:hypothetical protein